MAKHNFEIEKINKRKENVINQNKPGKIDTEDLCKIQNRFNDSIKDVKGLMDICIKLEQSDKQCDIDDDTEQELLRAQIVLLDSALDFYIHEISKYGITKIFNEDSGWNETQEFLDYKLSMKICKEIYYNRTSPKKISDVIGSLNNYSSFMKFDAIVKQLIMLGIIEDKSNIPLEITKYRDSVNAICERRNLIAHSSDRDFYKGHKGEKQLLKKESVDNWISKIKEFQSVIQNYIMQK